MTKNPNAAYEIVTKQIVDMLEAGTVPWRKPWKSHGMPTSMSTKKPYRGINPFLLNMQAMLHGYTSPFWGTYDQIGSYLGQIRKGEKSTLIVFWKTGTRQVKDENTGEVEARRWAVLRYFRVFNIEQADWPEGVPARFQIEPLAEHNPIMEAQQVLDRYLLADNPPSFGHGGDRAYYSPSADAIRLPVMGTFETAEAYYSTAFHEATHSTGHKSRLNRDGIVENHFFGDPWYAKEELVAEMGAAMLSAVTGIEQHTLPNSAAYLQSWIKALKGDPKLVVSAAAQAQRAADLILGTEFPTDGEDN